MYYTDFHTKSISECMLSLVSFLNKYRLRQRWVQTAATLERFSTWWERMSLLLNCGRCILWAILEHGERAGVGSQRGSGILSYEAWPERLPFRGKDRGVLSVVLLTEGLSCRKGTGRGQSSSPCSAPREKLRPQTVQGQGYSQETRPAASSTSGLLWNQRCTFSWDGFGRSPLPILNQVFVVIVVVEF